MRKKEYSKMTAKVLTAVAGNRLSAAANSRCALVYHQPEQPKELNKFRKF